MRIAVRSRNRSPAKRRERDREILVRAIAAFSVGAVATLQILEERIVAGSRREIGAQAKVRIRIRGTNAWICRDVMPATMRVPAQKERVVVEAQPAGGCPQLPAALEKVGRNPLG